MATSDVERVVFAEEEAPEAESGMEGSALVELALSMTLLMVIFAGVVNYSVFIMVAMQVQEAAAAGAAFGAIPSNASNASGMQTAAKNASPAVTKLTVTSSTEYMCTPGGTVVSSSSSCSTGKPPLEYVVVKTSASAPPLVTYIGISPTLQLTGVATMRVRWGS